MKLLRRKVLAAANGAMGQRFKRSTAPATVDIELTAIHTYAHFIAKHPDMPEDHRQRFLAKIVRSCEEIGEAFPWACREPVCKEQEP